MPSPFTVIRGKKGIQVYIPFYLRIRTYFISLVTLNMTGRYPQTCCAVNVKCEQNRRENAKKGNYFKLKLILSDFNAFAMNDLTGIIVDCVPRAAWWRL